MSRRSRTWGRKVKRSPIERKTPLLRSSFLPQQGPSREQRPEKTPQKTRGSRRDTGPSHEVRALVAARDEGRCLVCGGAATQLDHRRNRGMGNANRDKANVPSNLASVCGMGGSDGCHGMITNPANFGLTLLETQANGWNVSTLGTVDTAKVPYLCFDGWHWLTDDGERIPCGPDEFSESP